MNKIISLAEAVDKISDEMTLMFGGFMGCGSPHRIIDALVEKGVKNLSVICSDSGLMDFGVGKLIVNGQIRKLYASHIGLNSETGRRMNNGEMEVELIPQGTFVERIRCGGAGIGGFLTPTGIGTLVEEGKRKIEVNGKEYLLETPLRADIALLSGYMVDPYGNVFYKGSTRNFNPVMATAADLVIVEADKVVGVGSISKENIVTPGIFVDYIVDGRAK